MLGRDKGMQPGFVDFQILALAFGFASRETIFRSFKNLPGGISPGL